MITEVMYHPPDLVHGTGSLDNVAEEFIELHNLTGKAVPLYDPLRPANTWRLRDGVEFDLPPFVTLAPHGYLLVVSFDPVKDLSALATFHSEYSFAPGTQLVGPYEGRLDNGGDAGAVSSRARKSSLIRRRRVPAGGGQVRYGDAYRNRWRDGSSVLAAPLRPAYGNDPINWFAGPRRREHLLDTDDDGMPTTGVGERPDRCRRHALLDSTATATRTGTVPPRPIPQRQAVVEVAGSGRCQPSVCCVHRDGERFLRCCGRLTDDGGQSGRRASPLALVELRVPGMPHRRPLPRRDAPA